MKPTFAKALKSAAITSAFVLVLNHTWNAIAINLLDVATPNGPWIIAVSFSSVVPLLLAGVVYYFMEKFTEKGTMLFTTLSVVLTLLSLYSSFMPVMPDGTAAPAGFPLLSAPMHLIAGFSAALGIPRFSK